MHEYSIVQALLERVEQELRARGGTRVHSIRVCIGELAGVEIDLLRTAYETIRAGRGCEDASLEVRRSEARWECAKCGTAIARGARLRCPACDRPAGLVSGGEIMLERIEMEVA